MVGRVVAEGRSAADELAMANVATQLEHLRAHPAVADALQAGRRWLTGIFFGITSASMSVLGEGTARFLPATATGRERS